MAQLALDLFNRTESSTTSGWGTMSDGVNTWGDYPAAGSYSISGGVGQITNISLSAGFSLTDGPGHVSTSPLNLYAVFSTSSTSDFSGVAFCGTTTVGNEFQFSY